MTGRALAAVVVVGLLVVGGLSLLRAQQPQADLILSNGKILTVDERFTIAQAVAVAGDRIIAVGTNQDVNRLARSRNPANRPPRTDGRARTHRQPHAPAALRDHLEVRGAMGRRRDAEGGARPAAGPHGDA